MPPATREEQRKLVLMLVGWVVVLHAAMIGIYYWVRIADRPEKTQQTFVAVWVVLTLLVVVTPIKKIRKSRGRGA